MIEKCQNNSSLVVVGSGIKFLSHLTVEAKTYIEQSDVVLYLINEPALQAWIRAHSKNSQSLEFLYLKYDLRLDAYNAIAEYVLKCLAEYMTVCMVIYGHPTVLSYSALKAIQAAQSQGIHTKILPGISTEDCLFADLAIDPSNGGSLSYEATDFLIYDRLFDPYSHLILWQVDAIGNLGHFKTDINQVGLQLLQSYLLEKYQPTHEIVLYEAAQYPTFNPRIQRLKLQELINQTISPIATLYVPPVGKKTGNREILRQLRMTIR